MELTVLDVQVVNTLIRELKEVGELVREITEPYRALQQKSKWLDQQEVCQLLGISKRTVQTYRAKGLLKNTRINRKNFFRMADIERLMQSDTASKKGRL
ncbi:helix-turn-helix domain-containing protein [Flavobacterium supellecticarium]|uniref:Helix-turn-helix domain-containing protein n=1 Tax=Flavobacterium supellecticarium TaxID=2565924 RepID=A0A4S4A3H3_9FLAO|nr:helix-turn-helix domain-containing protein [Flavobacterium supellecticarium]THF52962.1 helix-turn-helix domain-containing protein [Flavobacterium supellecticarium]